jgi:hypothetical protein
MNCPRKQHGASLAQAALHEQEAQQQFHMKMNDARKMGMAAWRLFQ